ncbi:hypothetical protein N7478_009152 [Penicillium angulare]|uniref:uncharacterized protein n=1 Tax=Penicillium angulare TaxID=116970 RepID=UPI002541F1DB|nr:uncharacterized protein N7478_009152 [Penicillium angulare]KAJ5274027.1 hypothetical protein N7478_009152 [Penicillium angulare]
MISSKIVATVIVAVGFSSSTLACVNFKGRTNGQMTVTDDVTGEETETCQGGTLPGDNDLDCIDGFSLNYDYSDNPEEGGMPVTYCNEHACGSITIPFDVTGAYDSDFDYDYGDDC